MKDQLLIGHVNPSLPEQEHLNCPRCDSPNTKFCYYNNYNLSQPRHYCKNCKRYWTKGGILRDIPIGGVSRKKNTKRSSTTRKDSSSSSSTSAAIAFSSMGGVEKDSSSSLNVCFDQESKTLDLSGGVFGALLGTCNEEDEEDEEDEEIRNVDQENSNSTSTSFRNRGNWLDLAM